MTISEIRARDERGDQRWADVTTLLALIDEAREIIDLYSMEYLRPESAVYIPIGDKNKKAEEFLEAK